MSDTGKKQKRLKLSIILSIALSLSIIILILYFTVDAKTIDQLSSVHIRYEFFIAAVLLNVLFWVIWGARLMVLSNAIEKSVHVGLWESTKIVIANMFLAGITPSMAGGEPVRIYLLNKDGKSLGGATAAVLGERLIDAIFILICVPFALFVFRDRIHDPLLGIGLTIGIIVFVVFIILFIYAVRHPEKIKLLLFFIDDKIQGLLKRKKTEKKIIMRINREVDNFHHSMVFFGKEGRRAFLLGGILTAVMWSAGFMIPSMLLLGLGLPPVLLENYAAQVLLLIVIMMPTTPGSSGVTEIGVYGLYAGLVASPFIGIFVLLFRFITFHMNIIAGAIFQYRIFKSFTSFSLDALDKHE